MISIIVPIFNAETTIERCLDSILQQKYVNYELLLIDDGSTDNSGTIIHKYASRDLRIRTFHKSNGGVSSARNLGLDNVAGEWVCFVDSDNYVSEDWLQNFSHYFSMHDIVISGFYNCHDNRCEPTSALSDFEISDLQHLIYSLQCNEMFGFLWSKAFKTRIIQEYQLRFNEAYALWEDEDFIFQYLQYVENFKYINSHTYYYQFPEKSKYADISLFDCSYQIMQLLDKLIVDNQLRAAISHKYRYHLTEDLLKYYEKGNYRLAFKKLSDYIALENEWQLSFFLNEFKARLFYFKRYKYVTHFLLILFYGCKGRTTRFISKVLNT